MQFPESWLREFCDPPLSTQALADLLTMSGMEVEDLRPAAPPFSGVVVGEVLAVARHPAADRLSVCDVDAGAGRRLTIVCGAPNVTAGMKAPCALVGALLPPAEEGGAPFAITQSTLRGVESQGMLCSARELKMSDDHAGLLALPEDSAVGADVREVLSLDDMLFTLKLTPNLGHALSVYGIAREVAALTGAPLKTPAFAPVAPAHRDKLPVAIEASDLCGRFSGRIVRNVNTKAATPRWMVERLARCGQRSVSALVDISNYVMFEYGRPSHIFDFDKIRGGLVVRWGRPGETLELLNGETVRLDAKVGVIADREAVESLAGIMGGERTAVSDATRNIYVEAAFWWPEAVAGRSRRYGFATDAGHRFERGVDPATTTQHIEHITRLVIDICGGAAGPIDDQITALPEREPVRLRVARAAKVIGMPVTEAECASVFERLGFAFTRPRAGELLVAPPSWRFDLALEEDLIEEVIRVLGYERLPEVPPVAPVTARPDPEGRRTWHAVRRLMAARGYFETINFSFVEERWEHELAGNPDPIRVLNPIASPLAVMRSSLLASLVGVLRHNLARKASRVRVFEVGRVFLRDAQARAGEASVAGVRQPMRLAGLAYGPADEMQWAKSERAVDFFDLKGDIEALFAPRALRFVAAEHPALHPGRSARVELDGLPVGFAGELHPRWRQAWELPAAPLLFELDGEPLLERPVPSFEPLPRFQGAWRDLAIIVGERVTHAELMAAIDAARAPLVRSARLFDIYKPREPSAEIGANEHGAALRLELRDDDATLTDERIEAEVALVLASLRERLGARLRT
jgi:phenylalanyl-tRNA synthetase beta chain